MKARSSRRTSGLLRRVNTLLAARYRTPRLGNLRNPISELIFIILSARTRGRGHEAAYRALRKRFRTWDALKRARISSIASVIHDAGLSRIKAAQIRGLLRRIDRDLGDLTGKQLRRMPARQLEAYLVSLPGVGAKTARCVMMYSLDHDVFPVDTHCMRLFMNIGILENRLRFEYAQDPLQALVPVDIRRSLHVNAVAHGRETCVPGAEQCPVCPILHLCQVRAGLKSNGTGSRAAR
jgi:endonuclease III